MAPLHFWFPQVIREISWSACFILRTWQKVAPLRVLLRVRDFLFLRIFSASRAAFGCFGALKQNQLRGVIGYSSITHIGWILGGATARIMYSLVYFFIYFVVSFLLIIKLSKINMKSRVRQDLSVVWLLYSIAGLPPLIGFLPKLWILFGCSGLVSFPLVASSVVMLYVYSSVAMARLSRIKTTRLGMSFFFLLRFPWILV